MREDPSPVFCVTVCYRGPTVVSPGIRRVSEFLKRALSDSATEPPPIACVRPHTRTHTHTHTHTHCFLWDSSACPGSQARNRLEKPSPRCVLNFYSLDTRVNAPVAAFPFRMNPFPGGLSTTPCKLTPIRGQAWSIGLQLILAVE